MTASGSFDVQLTPVETTQPSVVQFSLDKSFHGDLDGTSVGLMIASGNEDTGARAYVAIETVTATLDGRSGSFILVHRGTMTAADQALAVEIVPESGSGELVGIAGTMTIDASDGNHAYRLDYTLPE